MKVASPYDKNAMTIMRAGHKVYAKIKSHPKCLRLSITIILLLLSLIIFEEVVDDIFFDPNEGDDETLIFDEAILNQIQHYQTPRLNQMVSDLSALGSISVISLLSIIMLGLLISNHDWRGAFFLTLICAGTAFVPWWLKDFFSRERPQTFAPLTQVETYSFPSGHSFASTAIYLGLAYLASRRTKELKIECFYYTLALIVIVLVGFSRIYLGVHYPTDVIGGMASASAWFLLCSLLMLALAPKPL